MHREDWSEHLFARNPSPGVHSHEDLRHYVASRRRVLQRPSSYCGRRLIVAELHVFKHPVGVPLPD